MITQSIGIICMAVNLTSLAINAASREYVGVYINIFGIILSICCIIVGTGGLS